MFHGSFPRFTAVAAVAAFVIASSPAAAQEESAGENPYWVIEFKPESLRFVSPKAGAGEGKVYWYLVYTLENKSGEDREVYVNISAKIDGKKSYTDLFLPAAERAAERRESRPLWGKTDQFKEQLKLQRDPKDPKYQYTTLKSGEKRRCVAVFNRVDPNVTTVEIEIAGLSNEIREEDDPDSGERRLVQRVRKLAYERKGDEFAIPLDRFRFKGARWATRAIPYPRPEGN